MSLSQIELVSVRVRVEEECFWVNLRDDNQVSESKMAVSESKMAEFKMTAIIKLSQNEWVKFFFVQNGWIQDGRIQDGCHHQVEWDWMSLSPDWIRLSQILNLAGKCEWSFFLQIVGTNLGKCEWVWEEKLRWAESKMGEFKMACHHQVEWEWMSLSQIELVWVRVRVEGECFWVNLREENKVSEFHNPKLIPRWQNSGWLPLLS